VSEPTQAPDPVAAELAKYPDLVPGAVEQLSSLWSGSLGKLPADQLAATIRDRMDGPLVARYRDPEASAARLPDGGTPSELRKALERNSARLLPGAVDALVGRLAHEVAGRRPSEVAGHVEKFLHGRDAHDFLAVRPELPAGEARLQDLLHANFGRELDSSQIADLARDRSGQLGRLPDQQVVSSVARTLRLDARDPRVTGQAADPFGHRAVPAATPKPPARDESGQFKPAEAPPARQSLVR
jgi:hypothetical protein